MRLAALFIVTAALAAAQLAPGQGAIRGVVLKAGVTVEQPLWNARMELNGPGGTAVARTDANGRFVFAGLRPGQYRLTVTCDGFIRQDYPKRIVVVGGQQGPAIVFQMEPAPTAAGRVLDIYGEPIANVMIEALRRAYDVRGRPKFSRAAVGVTDDRGEYRVFWLDPGEYFFYASSVVPASSSEQPPARAVVPTYAPDVNAPEDAKPIRFDIGREVRIDFRLRQAALWGVNGQTMGLASNQSIPAAVTLTPPSEDPSLSRYRGQSSPRGGFAINDVAPGTYIVSAKATGSQDMIAFQRLTLRPVLAAPQGGYQVTLTMTPPLAINGQLFMETRDSTDPRPASISLISADSEMPSPKSVPPQRDGQFLLNGVVPGEYVLDLTSLPDDLYLKAARWGSNDVLESPLRLEATATLNLLQILIGSDGGRLQAAAYNARGELHTDVQFVLVPDPSRRHRREQYRLATSADDGIATFRGIPPGRYKLFAWESLEPNAYLNADYLRGYEDLGTPVNIAAGDNAPVSVVMIPKQW